MSEQSAAAQTSIVESHFIRGRNILVSEGDFSLLFQEYERQAEANGTVPEGLIRKTFLQGLAVFALHCASKPKNQVFGWTLNLATPPLNLFFGGDTGLDHVVGRWFTENVEVTGHNRFYQEVAGRTKEVHRSFVPFQGNDLMLAAETFYQQSEQRPARFFQMSESRFLMLSAHPDYDKEWFDACTHASVQDLAEKETLVFMERRPVIWSCGCTQEKIVKMLRPLFQKDPEDFMQGKEFLTIQCPRCAASYQVSRKQLEGE
jgi:molecular chaperone Hsp33